MHVRAMTAALATTFTLSACGGDDTSVPLPQPTSTTSSCSLSQRQAWVRSQLDEWYLFPNLLDTSVQASSFGDVQSYIDALVAPARAQSRDRFFTYITSIKEETEFFERGETAGFGIRLSYDSASRRVFVTEAFENAPAFAQGLDRGVELLAIGDNPGNLTGIPGLFAEGGSAAVSNALGPNTVGTTRTFRIRKNGVESEVTVSKADYQIQPLSPRYGSRILDLGNGRKVGYVNLRTFIDTAEPALRSAFDSFRQQGITEVIVDVRYNGGGLVRIGQLFGDLLQDNRQGQIFGYLSFRASKSSENNTLTFTDRPEGIRATKIAFIGTGGTASASELIMNNMTPYLSNVALVGSDTFGKPVGQIALDKAECDDRLRSVSFKTDNANRQGEYFTGIASVFPNTCRAADDFTVQLGEPNEASIRTSIEYINGGVAMCAPITSGEQGTQSVRSTRELLRPERPTVAQIETPGLF